MIDSINVEYAVDPYANICETLYYIDGVCICSFNGEILKPKTHNKLEPVEIEQLILEYHKIYGVKQPKFAEFNQKKKVIQINSILEKYSDYEVIIIYDSKTKTFLIDNFNSRIHPTTEKVFVRDITDFEYEELIKWAKVNNLI